MAAERVAAGRAHGGVRRIDVPISVVRGHGAVTTSTTTSWNRVPSPRPVVHAQGCGGGRVVLDVLLDNMLMLASHIAVGGALVLNMLTVEPTTFSQDTSPMMLRRHAPEMSSVYRSQCREPSLRPARFWASTTSPISSRHRAAKERRRVYVCTSVRIERVHSTTRSWITYVMRINRLFSFSMHEIIHLLENFVPIARRTAAITTQQPGRTQRFANWIIRRYDVR